MKTATVFNIQRFSLQDGPGTRTTVFFKGCPLKCLWCANPESQVPEPELEVLPGNCIGCGSCVKVCPNDAIYFDEGGIHIRRDRCARCGRCAEECYSKTLKYVGKRMSVDDVVDEIIKDEVFYRTSGGGVTFSGGEPLLHGEFCLDVIKRSKPFNLRFAIETSGYGDKDILISLAKELDLMFFDIKHTDPEKHEKLTGVSNEKILENLRSIQKYAKNIVLRTPLMKGINDEPENVCRTAQLCSELESVSAWEILPYHNLGEHKYDAIGREHEEFSKPDGESLRAILKSANDILHPKGKECRLEGSGVS